MNTNLILLLGLTIWSSQSHAQHEFFIPTAEVVKHQITKAPEGTVWVNPVKINGKLKTLPDTMHFEFHPAMKYYIDYAKTLEVTKSLDSVLKSKNSKVTIDIPVITRVSAKEVLSPFYIKTTEVTNAEYKRFLADFPQLYNQLVPDTNCWVKDFQYSFNDPMTRHYFSHPKYNDYPVVGISYYNAKAYCAWFQQNLNTENKVEGMTWFVDLPNQFEWSFASGDRYHTQMGFIGQGLLVLRQRHYDHNYITNLPLTYDTTVNLINQSLLSGYLNITRGNFMDDGYLYTTSTSMKHHKRNKGNIIHRDYIEGVRFMNTNLSEWCSENYADNWRQVYELRQQYLKANSSEEAELLAQIEKFYNAQNSSNGVLVKGGNWYFEQHATRDGVNVGTQAAKRFVDPGSKHSTLGFRYVLRLVSDVKMANN